MSDDFDPDAYLQSPSSAPAAFDPDAYLSQSSEVPTPAPAQAAPPAAPPSAPSIVRRNPTMGAINTPSADVSNLVQAGASGVNSNVYDMVGLPMDTATKASNLLKSGAEAGMLKMGMIPPTWLDPDKPESVFGTSDWLKRKTREAGGANLIDAIAPKGTDLSALHTVAEAVGPAPIAAGLGRRLGNGNVVPPGTPESQPSSLSDSPQSMGAAKTAPQVGQASPELQAAIRQAAQNTGGAVSEEALSRHLEADSLPIKIPLTRGQAQQDPVAISQEMNMRGKHPELAQRFDEQNQALKSNVTALRDAVGPDVFSANQVEHGDTLIKAYQDKDSAIRSDITSKYQALKDANGGQFPVDGETFVANADKALSQNMKGRYVPNEIKADLGDFREGKQMTFEQFENLRTNLAAEARKAERSGDGNAMAAVNIVREQLESLPLKGDAANLKPLADAARSAAKARFDMLRADPAYKAAVDETVPPDRFTQKFLLGPQATRDGVALMRENLGHDPVATQTMSVATLDHLRKSAGIDEMGNGNFTQAGYNKNLQALGPRLNSLVDPATAEHLSTLGNVARYTQFQPRGSFVNNSNTFTASMANYGASALEGAANVAAKGVPVGTWTRNFLKANQEKKEVDRALAVGAGLTKLSDVGK